MKLNYSILIFVFLFIFTEYLSGQSMESWESKKRESIKKIKLAKALLEDTKTKRAVGIHDLNLLKESIKYRNLLIDGYLEEIEYYNNSIKNFNNSIDYNSKILDKLKNEYSVIIRKTYRNIEDEYVLMFLLSSSDINQSYQRIRYIKYLNKYRKNLYMQIIQRNDSLEILKYRMIASRNSRKKVIDQLSVENEMLNKDKSRKESMLTQLKGKEKELLVEIKKYIRTRDNIEKEIKKLIEEERRKERAGLGGMSREEENILSNNFNENKGKLKWPSKNSIITGKYGEHNHPVIPGIKIRSNGIDLVAEKNSDVIAVFEGEVTVVSAILGANFTVIIRHGNYRSVYQNLKTVNIKAGEMVSRFQVIGKAGDSDQGKASMHFELWKGMETVNPEIWLMK